MRKGKRRVVEEAFTETGKGYQVKCNVTLDSLKQALALRSIISSFQTSAFRRGNNGKNMG